jgi:DNA-binding XRE family transcriptional regulator
MGETGTIVVAKSDGLVIIPTHIPVNSILVKITIEGWMLTTGNQLRAARGLVAMDQITLAQRAGVSANTIRAMEARGAETLTSGLDTVRSVQSALEAAGVEFLDHGRPGVQLKDRRGTV